MAKKGKQKQGSAGQEPKKQPAEVIVEVDEELSEFFPLDIAVIVRVDQQ